MRRWSVLFVVLGGLGGSTAAMAEESRPTRPERAGESHEGGPRREMPEAVRGIREKYQARKE